MRLTKGADVYASDGEKLGTLDRVILDPETREVMNLVISRGHLVTTKKIVGLEAIDQENKDKITLRSPKHDLDDFLDFEETHYVNGDQTENPASDELPTSYWYPPINLAWWRAGGTDNPILYPGQPVYVSKTTQNIPEGTVALEEGAKVMSKDEKHVGNIVEVVVDPQDHRVTHFVIDEGILFKERKLVPVTWISEIDENEVHLSVAANTLDHLPAYQTAR
jgi:uncharacterized protein YrrD